MGSSITERACSRIAPTWPLDRFIAVNPFWGLIDEPLPQASMRLGALSGTRLVMPRAWYREQHHAGRLRDEHLEEALARLGSPLGLADVHALLEREAPAPPRRAHVVDVADAQRDLVHRPSWRDFVTNATSQLCATWFDEGQAHLVPDRAGGLWGAWLRQARLDEAPRLLMGMRDFRELARALPESPDDLFVAALTELDVPAAERDAYLHGLLLDQNGWAAFCAYHRWTARLEGGDDDAIVHLLAIRLAWEWMLLRSAGRALAAKWQLAMASWPAVDTAVRAAQEHDWILQEAMEIAWQADLCAQLPSAFEAKAAAAPRVQAVFCIDVRSERFRRALEAQTRDVETRGFAGFFGLPVAYAPLGASDARPQLPGLLAPKMRVVDGGGDGALAARRRDRLRADDAFGALRTGPLTAFGFVEALGPLYAGDLLADTFGLRGRVDVDGAGLAAKERAGLAPRLDAMVSGEALSLEAKVDLAAGVLRAMGLVRGFAPLVVLVGHGSQSKNNPHAAGLDCGACCGQTGEVNARAAAALLEERDVRAGLAARGIAIPEGTRFVAALHDTTTDEVRLLGTLPASLAPAVVELRGWLDAAGASVRAERAASLGLDARAARDARGPVQARARDWSCVRPEWGLAGNAAFVIAPRERTRDLDLGGRAFLHDYRAEDDPGFAILELLMTAPMIVTHWINLQYYASTVDNRRWGSGNKVLHDVVGGHLGVFEGNGGDLRIGLPLQSLHDGERWVHEPLRLSVFVEAPREAIEGVLRKHEHVAALVNGGWIHLFQLDAAERAVHAWRDRRWVPASPDA